MIVFDSLYRHRQEYEDPLMLKLPDPAGFSIIKICVPCTTILGVDTTSRIISTQDDPITLSMVSMEVEVVFRPMVHLNPQCKCIKPVGEALAVLYPPTHTFALVFRFFQS